MCLYTDNWGYFDDFSIMDLFDWQLPTHFTPSVRFIKGDNWGNIQKYILLFFGYIE